MKIAGIIAEYNPFHNGHALHVRRTREATGCDYVIACMDGHFTQRGEAARFSKWARVRMALSCGVDAVFELPALFAVRPAEVFATGGVAILDGLGANVLSFGSETADMGALNALAEVSLNEPEQVSEAVRRGLEAGKSHARARGEAVAGYLGLDPEALNKPNAILAVEYLRALRRRGSRMEAAAIERVGGYHDQELGTFASASAVRAAFDRGDAEGALSAIPGNARPFARPDAMHGMDDILLYRLRDMSPEALAGLPEVGEGLENRVGKLCREHATRQALLEALKCKRYTWSRLSRTLTQALIGMDSGLAAACPEPPYARLLGVREDARPLLRELGARASIPIASSAEALRGNPCFELECRATDLWALMHDQPAERLPGREFTERFVKV